MINVVRLISFFTGESGGPYNHIMELTSYLEKMGVNTKVFTTSFTSPVGRERTQFFEKKREYFTIYRFNSSLKFRDYRISLKTFPYLLKEANNIDIFHSHSIRSYQEDIGSIISLIKKKPFVITPHGAISLNWVHGDKIPKMLHDKTIGFFKRKLLNSHFIAVAKNEIPIIKNYGIDENYIHYIPHGINTKIFKPVDSSNLKKSYNLENFDIILYVGRIAKGKGVDILIKILNIIVKKNKNVKLVIVGGDSGFLHEIKSQINKYNLTNYVIFAGFIKKKILPKFYSMADLVVYPSRKEIFGHVICEAGACGKAVIGSDIMGPSEIIVDGKTGYTSDFKDIDKVGDLIINLLNDKSLLNQLGKNALKRVTDNYSWKKSAEAHLKLYKDILNSK